MESASVPAKEAKAKPEVGAKGLKKDSIGFLDGLSIGLGLDSTRLLACGCHRLDRGCGRCKGAGGPPRLVRPDVLHRGRVLLHEPRRHRLRHHVQLGHARDGPVDGLARRLGDLHHRHPGDRLARRRLGLLLLRPARADGGETNSGNPKPLYKDDVAVAIGAVVIIAVMTAICVVGTEISAKLQRFLTIGQVAIMLMFAAAVFVRLIFDKVPESSISPEAQLALPLRRGVLRDVDRGLVSGLYLLGLGVGREPLRGERGLLSGAGPGGPRQHDHPAGHLRRPSRSRSSPTQDSTRSGSSTMTLAYSGR